MALIIRRILDWALPAWNGVVTNFDSATHLRELKSLASILIGVLYRLLSTKVHKGLGSLKSSQFESQK